ncbi:hypothetical protein [Marinobacterium aestuariivivens]|uniref:Uncharacterized protein n=1 Tax=Marinobacterium aestuariivivens TaxID=1698799 RepID=A0ABW2AA61_9GAMM
MIRVIFTVAALLLFVAPAQMLFTGQLGGELFMIEAAFPLRLVAAVSLLASAVIALYGRYWTSEDGGLTGVWIYAGSDY